MEYEEGEGIKDGAAIIAERWSRQRPCSSDGVLCKTFLSQEGVLRLLTFFFLLI